METPTTRSRAKREAEAHTPDDAGSIAWVHDQGLHLRAAVLAASMDNCMPPTPTQQPRPITSRPRSNGSPSTASAPPRKRRCRPHRSLPQPLTGSSSSSIGLNANGSGAGSSSAPAAVSSSSRLDELLGEAMAAFAIRPAEMESFTPAVPVAKQVPAVTMPTRSILQVSSREDNIPRLAVHAGPSVKLSNGSITTKASHSTMRATDATTKDLPERRADPSRLAKSSVSPTKPGTAPRIGLRHTSRPASKPLSTGETRQMPAGNAMEHGQTANPTTRIPNPNTAQKSFKSPLIPAQPIRSSPRRHTSLSVVPRTEAPNRALHPQATAIQRAAGGSAHAPSPFCKPSEKSAPSSDGLDADDSFDGIFQSGGVEVEMLLRTVDGSQ